MQESKLVFKFTTNFLLLVYQQYCGDGIQENYCLQKANFAKLEALQKKDSE